MTHQSSHGGVKPKALRIIHIFISSEPSKDSLPKKGHDLVLDVLAQATLAQLLSRHLTQTQGLIEFSEGEQPCVRCDGGSPELQLQSAVKFESERALRGFTHWVFPTMGRVEGLSV
jgi:hypothetical protein